MLTVDPEYQRRGAGTMMVRWGVDIADRIGAEVCNIECHQLCTLF